MQKAITQCCSQLKVKLAKAKMVKDALQRKKRLHQYIPNVSRALQGALPLSRCAEVVGGPSCAAAMVGLRVGNRDVIECWQQRHD